MGTHTLRAAAKYDDWRGSVAADDADRSDVGAWIKEKKLAQPGEFLVGLEAFLGENHGAIDQPIYLTLLFAKASEYETVKQQIDSPSGPIEVRRVTADIDALEFLALFKRFSIALARHGMLSGREYHFQE